MQPPGLGNAFWVAFATGIMALAACGGPADPAGIGAPCFRAAECQAGLVCIEKQCTNDLTSIDIPPPDAAGGAGGSAVPMRDGSPPDVTAGGGGNGGAGGAGGSGGGNGSGGKGGGAAGMAPKDSGAAQPDLGRPAEDAGSD
ncbi:MAG TPA: hypothetical protein VJT73_13905 [Polyangiaceae bacterium]|nr:hypothetical protein [Polyangiaceae bacterium]